MTDADASHGPDVREQRLVFGEDAELYDKARAGYPESLVDDVLAFVGGKAPQVRALEVGAGTGKATMSFARRGVDIVALEPSGPWPPWPRATAGGFPMSGSR